MTPSPASSSPRGPGPLTLDTRALGHRAGAQLTVRETVPLPESIGVELVRLPEGRDLDLDLVLTCVEEGVLVTGSVHGVADVECARCLAQLESDVEVSLTDLYAYRDSAAAAGAENDEVRLLDGDLVPLLPALVDAFGLAFPLAPTCQDEGLEECLEATTPAPDGVSGDPGATVDPRWAGLADKLGEIEDGR